MTKNVIVVTGANNGIGFHMTKTLLEDGYCVVVLDISDENLIPVKTTYPEQLLVFDCDVTDSARVNDTVSSVIEKWGYVDVLVNNACLAIFKPFEQKPLEETRREFEVNYFGYVNTIAAVLPYMKSKGKGIILTLLDCTDVLSLHSIRMYRGRKSGG
jgi:NADP-dependent 3-hydroxy acid dehydrogenase YdfG